MKLVYYKNLDGVRAIAALMVVFFHFFHEMSNELSPTLSIIKKIASIGQTGVTLFFVLSGFLITRILINTKDTEGYFKNFYVRRTLRIFPLYYFFLVIYFFVSPLFLTINEFHFNDEFYYFTYLQGFARTFGWDVSGPNHFWSLAVEEHFYLFWPFVIFYVAKKNLGKIILAIIILAILVRVILLNNNYSVFLFTFTRIDSLAIGAILALLELKKLLTLKHIKYFIGLFVGLVVVTLLIWILLAGEGSNYIQNLRYLLLSLVYFSMLGSLLCIPKEHGVNRLLETRFFQYTGKISYGLYVYHPLVFMFCVQYLHTDYLILNLIIGTLITYVVAGLSYKYFESQFLRLKKYFEYKKPNSLSQPKEA